MVIKHPIGALLLFLLIGCGIPTAIYKISLQTVERPTGAKKRYGEHEIVTKQDGGISVYIFEDEMVRISWKPGISYTVSFGFTLLNKTNHSIKIVWEEAAFVDKEVGRSYRVTHSLARRLSNLVNGEVRYTDTQPSPVVAPQGVTGGFIIPVGYVFPRTGENIQSLTKSYIGKTYQVLLPLQIENVVNEYIFTFRVDDAIVLRLE